MIAAHPDDEDTELLTVLARGMGAEAAYLSLTRGEGGQNLIGNELGPALGVLRTEELLAARSLDGARQYFTRAYDFGFSKSLADTWKFWHPDSVLKDVVRVIRRFQPQVIVAIFSGTPRDGHGQHQASGWVAREGFTAAADPGRFPELAVEGLSAWKTLKLYQSARFNPDTAVTTLNGGEVDRAVGQSYLQIAMRGRSLHRSQDMGVPQPMGPSTVRLRLLEDLTGAGPGLFAGIDTTLASALPPDATAEAREAAGRVMRGLAGITQSGPEAGRIAGMRAEWATIAGSPSQTAAARDQLARLDAAAWIASGMVCDATTGTGTLIPGGRIMVSLACWNTGAEARGVSAGVALLGREVFTSPRRAVPPGQVISDSVVITVPADAAPTQPYYLRAPMQGAWYRWRVEDSASWSLPSEPAPLVAEFQLDGAVLRRDVVRRTVDQALGEVRTPLFIAPRVDVHLSPGSGLWSRGRSSPHEVRVALLHHAVDTTTGSVKLEVPQGWTAPPSQPFTLEGRNADRTLRFEVRPPASVVPGSFELRAVVTDGAGRQYSAGTERVVYPHIRSRQLVGEATSRAVVADLRLSPATRVGYVRGAADRIPESLTALGVDVALISADSLMRGGLRHFRTVVIGPRAWETEPALSAHNDRLLGWVREGGTLIVQYQQFQYLRGDYAPFALSLAERPGAPLPQRVGAPRVAEEDAPVTVLDPAHPAFHFPNVITQRDWDGWVQERGLYFPRSWDEQWKPLLEMGDSGEPPQRGALLVAKYGRGTYVYTGLSFFRELPAAVPGAARLFLNLLALGTPRG